jgi:hypothetical protein
VLIGHFDRERLLKLKPSEFGGSSPGDKEHFRLEFVINDPRGVICFEAFEAGADTEWAYWHDEFHVCMSGSASVEYTLPPNHQQLLRAEIKTGDALLILGGTRARFTVPAAEPYVHASLFQPRYDYAKYLLTEKYDEMGRAPSRPVI